MGDAPEAASLRAEGPDDRPGQGSGPGGAAWPRPVRFGEDAAISAIVAQLTAEGPPSGVLHGVERAELARWSERTGLPPMRLLDRLAAELALGFHAGQLGYGACDAVVNALHAALYQKPPGRQAEWADLFWQTYLAFDAGEYARPGEMGEDPVETRTRPLIAAIVERLLPDGGWHVMFHDASATGFVMQDDELRIETEAFACSFTETMPAGRIVIAGLQGLQRDGEALATFEVESEDAEIHGLDGLPDGVRLWLIWHFWTPRAPPICRAYWFPGATVRVEALAGGPLVPVWEPSSTT